MAEHRWIAGDRRQRDSNARHALRWFDREPNAQAGTPQRTSSREQIAQQPAVEPYADDIDPPSAPGGLCHPRDVLHGRAQRR